MNCLEMGDALFDEAEQLAAYQNILQDVEAWEQRYDEYAYYLHQREEVKACMKYMFSYEIIVESFDKAIDAISFWLADYEEFLQIDPEPKWDEDTSFGQEMG